MLVVNTTYYVDYDMRLPLTEWLRDEMASRIRSSKLVRNPRIMKMLGINTDEQTGIAMQFEVDSLSALREWHNTEGKTLGRMIDERFNGEVHGFTTMLEVVDDKEG